jgi:hypothetical protein
MAENVLVEGKPRIGWMIDGNTDTPYVSVMLELTTDQIVLTVPMQGMIGNGDPYARWFSSGIEFVSDGQVVGPTELPRVLKFYDYSGVVMLVDCRTAGYNSNMAAGAGRIVANYAVLGEYPLEIRQINGILTEMPALAAWTRLTSTRREAVTNEEHRVQELTVTLQSPAATKLASSKNLTMRPSWRTSVPERGTLATHDVVQLVTETRRKDSWNATLAPHRALQDLLSLSAWRAFGFSRIEIGVRNESRADPDPRFAPEPAMRWSEVVTHRHRLHEPWKTEPRFLFTYADIGARGVRRWLKMLSTYERAMLPFISMIDQRGMFVQTRVLQTGIALEALGFQLASEAAPPALNSRGQINYNDALKMILDDMPVVPLVDVAAWRERSRLSYMGVKHADNPMPDMLTVANAYRENALVLRYWLAARLGCSEAVLRDRLSMDPLADEYVAAV